MQIRNYSFCSSGYKFKTSVSQQRYLWHALLKTKLFDCVAVVICSGTMLFHNCKHMQYWLSLRNFNQFLFNIEVAPNTCVRNRIWSWFCWLCKNGVHCCNMSLLWLTQYAYRRTKKRHFAFPPSLLENILFRQFHLQLFRHMSLTSIYTLIMRSFESKYEKETSTEQQKNEQKKLQSG